MYFVYDNANDYNNVCTYHSHSVDAQWYDNQYRHGIVWPSAQAACGERVFDRSLALPTVGTPTKDRPRTPKRGVLFLYALNIALILQRHPIQPKLQRNFNMIGVHLYALNEVIYKCLAFLNRAMIKGEQHIIEIALRLVRCNLLRDGL